MSQSKMTVTDDTEKKFVIKHIFKNVKKMKEGETVDGPIEYHYGIPWKTRILRDGDYLKTYLDCMVSSDNAEWLIDTEIKGKTIHKSDEFKRCSVAHTYHKRKMGYCYFCYFMKNGNILNNGDFGCEFTVIIEKVTGLDLDSARKLKNFDDESAKENSDVTLIVKDQKFHVLKKYLANHSTYFQSLFSGNFSESQKSEIELKDIDPNDFQSYLDLIYGESTVEDYSVLKILHLADLFDSKTAIRRCDEFLLQKSNLPLKDKFHAAIKYNLEELKIKCISEMKTIDDLRSIISENSGDFNTDDWKELFLKALSLNSK